MRYDRHLSMSITLHFFQTVSCRKFRESCVRNEKWDLKKELGIEKVTVFVGHSPVNGDDDQKGVWKMGF